MNGSVRVHYELLPRSVVQHIGWQDVCRREEQIGR